MTRIVSFLLLFWLVCPLFAQRSYEEALRMGDDSLQQTKFKSAINLYFAAEAFDPTPEHKKVVQGRVNQAFDKIEALRKEADRAKEKAKNALQKLKKANEDFVMRFLENARADMRDSRFEDALDKIKTAGTLGVLEAEVFKAYMGNVDSSIFHRNFSPALESVKSAANFGILKPEELGKAYLKIAEGSVLNLKYETALESVKSVAALDILKPEVTKAYLEMAFWYGETGNIERTTALLDSIAGFTKQTGISALLQQLPADTPAARNRLREAMRLVDAGHFTFLFEQKYYPDMVLVQGGTFMMGCDSTIDKNCESNETLHAQEVSTFRMARTETTVWQFALYRATEGRVIDDDTWNDPGNNPVVKVSWYDAVKYANWVSKQKGEKEAISSADAGKYAVNLRGGYRLPTEAEWEYAAKGGNRPDMTIYSGSNDLDSVGWYYKYSGSRTVAVGKKKANALGLYDMSGNAWEWCWDWYAAYEAAPEKDYRGPETGSSRVIRGGSWYNDPGLCRVAFRLGINPDLRGSTVGFRLVFVP